jgi:hypothetical protein
MKSRKGLSAKQQKILIVLMFLFAVLAVTGILVNVSLLWRGLNAIVWVILGIIVFRRYRETVIDE